MTNIELTASLGADAEEADAKEAYVTTAEMLRAEGRAEALVPVKPERLKSLMLSCRPRSTAACGQPRRAVSRTGLCAPGISLNIKRIATVMPELSAVTASSSDGA